MMFSIHHSSKILVGTAMTAGLLLSPSPSEAYRMIQNTTTGRVSAGSLVTCNDAGGFVHWTTSSISWRLNTAGQGSGKTTALTNALSSWTNVTSADHTLTYGGTTTAGWSTDGINTVLWANGNGCTGSCLALTALVLQAGQVIVETDITFNSNYTWNTNGSAYDTEAVMAHELGHSLGIHHTEIGTTPRPTMYASYFGTDGRSLHSDDQAALQCAQSKYPFGFAAPAFLNVQTHFCLGWVDLSWGAVSGATYYEVEASSTSSFTSTWLVYSGTGTSYTLNGSSCCTRWYRVRACNAGGCSSFRNGNSSAPYYSVCL